MDISTKCDCFPNMNQSLSVAAKLKKKKNPEKNSFKLKYQIQLWIAALLLRLFGLTFSLSDPLCLGC